MRACDPGLLLTYLQSASVGGNVLYSGRGAKQSVTLHLQGKLGTLGDN